MDLNDRYEATYRIQNQSKENGVGYMILAVSFIAILDNQKPLRMVGIRRDIHQERTVSRTFKTGGQCTETAAEGIFILNDELCYIDVNPFYEHLTGFKLRPDYW